MLHRGGREEGGQDLHPYIANIWETQHLRDSTFWESQHLGAPIDFIFLWSGQCQGSVPVQGAESYQPSATSHLG